ncbi:MAG: NAD-dependent epimerase/dehydratase family protein [Candidatus Bathyarchaeia archaeon]
MVTGGRGFIGSHLEARLKRERHIVSIFDRARVGERGYYRGDVNDHFSVERVFTQVRPRIVIHLAGMVSRKECEETPYLAIQTNVGGTLNIVQNCLRYKSRLIYAGSSEEYGTAFSSTKPVTEETPFGEPTSIYSMTKRMAEELIQYHAKFKGLEATTLRFFMLYGPNEAYSDYRSALIRFVVAARLGKPLTVHKNTARQWCYIDDAIEAIIKVVARRQEKDYEVLNIGNDEPISTEELAEKILRITDSKSTIKRICVEPTVIPVKLASFEAAQQLLKWEASTRLDEGLRKVCAELKR